MESLLAGIAELLLDPKYADLEIRCNGYSFKVQRILVCKRSEVLAKECDGSFQEATTRVVQHTVYDHYAVDRMLKWMYRGDYDIHGHGLCGTPCLELDQQQTANVTGSSGSSTMLRQSTDSRANTTVGAQNSGNNRASQPNTSTTVGAFLIAHVHVYAIADYYALPELKTLALRKFTAFASGLKTISTSDLLDIIAAVYGSTSIEAQDLRQQLLGTTLTYSASSIESAVFMKTISEATGYQEFAADFVTFSTARHRTERANEQSLHQATVQHLKAREEQSDKSHAEIVRLLKVDIKEANDKLRNAQAKIKTIEAEARKARSEAQKFKATVQPSRVPRTPFEKILTDISYGHQKEDMGNRF